MIGRSSALPAGALLRGGAIDRAGGLRRSGALSHGSRILAPDPPRLGPSMRGDDLAAYQLDAIGWLRERRRALLADEPGLGKTAQLLRALPSRARALVVCPASVSLTWRDEVAVWRPDLRATTRSPLRRPDAGEVLVISYDALPELPERGELLVPYPMNDVHLIPDECHMLKRSEASRTEKFRRLRAQCGWCWGATGTPQPGDPDDLWGVLESLGLSHVFADRATFVSLCGGRARKVEGGRELAGEVWDGEVSPEVRRALEPVMLRRRSDLLNLPPVRFSEVRVPVPEWLVIPRPGGNIRLAATELPKFSIHAEALAALARSRCDAAREWADNHASYECPLIVFSVHVEPVLAVADLRGAVHFVGSTPAADQDRAIRAFQEGRARILATTIACGGAGLNLQQARTALFVDRSYNPGDNEQAFRRLWRKGQQHPVWIAIMVSDHPLDRRLAEILTLRMRSAAATVG